MKEQIIKELTGSGQVTDIGTYTRSQEYKGYWLNDDDAPLCPYEFFNQIGTREEVKKAMLELRNDGLVELMPAVDDDGFPNGSGWALTEKGLHYAVDNDLVFL